MMIGKDIENAMNGMIWLAVIGMIAIFVFALLGGCGLLYGLWWAWNHVSITLH